MYIIQLNPPAIFASVEGWEGLEGLQIRAFEERLKEILQQLIQELERQSNALKRHSYEGRRTTARTQTGQQMTYKSW